MFKVMCLHKSSVIFLLMLEPSEQELADPKPPGDQTVTLQFDFHFDSLSIILYNSDSSQVRRTFLK